MPRDLHPTGLDHYALVQFSFRTWTIAAGLAHCPSPLALIRSDYCVAAKARLAVIRDEHYVPRDHSLRPKFRGATILLRGCPLPLEGKGTTRGCV